MRFLADMGISPVTVSFLFDLGHDVMHLHDEGLDELEDHRFSLKREVRTVFC
jgi:hypothetical protein